MVIAYGGIIKPMSYLTQPLVSGCIDAFVLKQIGEHTIEFHPDLMMVYFFDHEKAFDRVDRNRPWSALEGYGVHGRLLDSVRALY